MDSCKTCKWWTGNRADPKEGQCRRYPPAPAGLVQQQNALTRQVFPGVIFATPSVTGDHWCGEHATTVQLLS